MACKWIGPGWFLPATTLGFGICSVATAFVHDIHQVSAVRFLLGMFEAGLMPGIAYYLSRWYRRSEVRNLHAGMLDNIRCVKRFLIFNSWLFVCHVTSSWLPLPVHLVGCSPLVS